MALQRGSLPAVCLLVAASFHTPASGQSGPECDWKACFVEDPEENLQYVLDAAPPFANVVVNQLAEAVVSKTIRVTKPVTISGLRARLRPNLPRTPLLEIFAEQVTIRDFHLAGNIFSVAYADRASLIVVRRGRFLIENSEFRDSAKDGIMVTPDTKGPSIEHGVIRNIIGRNIARDVVSIAGLGDLGFLVRHVVVENLRCYGSRDRGAAEASDGSEYIAFRDIYSESSVYGIDVQDHNRAGQRNRYIVIENLRVRDCVSAVRTANHDFGHTDLVVRNVSGESFRPDARWHPIDIRNTRNVHLENIRLNRLPDGAALRVAQVHDLTVRDLRIREFGKAPAVVTAEGVTDALFENVDLSGPVSNANTGIHFRVGPASSAQSLRVRNCLLAAASEWDLVVDTKGEGGTLHLFAADASVPRIQLGLKPKVHRADKGQ